MDIFLILFGTILLLGGGGLLYLGCREWGFKRWAREFEESHSFHFATVMAAIIMGIVYIFLGLIGLTS